MRYVALGDSYTIGTSVDVAERFPDQLVAALATGTPPLPVALVANLGVDGYTSADLIRDELPPLGDLRPEFVSLCIGVNDVVQDVPIDRYAANATVILDALVDVVGARRIVVVSVPDYTVTPAGADYGDPHERRAGIHAVNAAMAALARDRGVAMVEIIDLSEAAATDRSLVAVDGLHPSGHQYARWVERIAPVVRSLVGA